MGILPFFGHSKPQEFTLTEQRELLRLRVLENVMVNAALQARPPRADTPPHVPMLVRDLIPDLQSTTDPEQIREKISKAREAILTEQQGRSLPIPQQPVMVSTATPIFRRMPGISPFQEEGIR